MREKIENLIMHERPFATKHFYIDYDKREVLYRVSRGACVSKLEFWSVEAMREAAEDLIKIADEIDDFKKFSENETYFFVHPAGSITSIRFSGLTTDIFNMTLGNIFKTEEEAESKKEEMLAKFEEARKKHVRN